MRFTAQIDELRRGVEYAARQANRAVGMAAYAGLAVVAREDEVFITGSDGRTSAEAVIPAAVGVEGRALVPATGLAGWLRAVERDGEVSMELTDEGLVGETEGGHSCRLVQIGLTFPKMSWPEGAVRAVDLGELGSAMRSVAHASAEGEGLMSNILLRAEEREISCMATDSYRVARHGGVAISGDESLEVVVPRETAERIAAMGAGTGAIVYGGGHTIGFRSSGGDRAVLTRVVAGKFPGADHLLERKYNHYWEVPKKNLTETLSRLRPFVGGRDLLVCSFKEGQLAVEAESEEVGRAREVVVGVTGGAGVGEALVVGLSEEFFGKAVGALRGERVGIHLDGAGEPILVVDAEGSRQMELVAPIRMS